MANPRRRRPTRSALAARKKPKQQRAKQMQQDILEASIRVFQREGPLKFTTTRVAEAAGISVGSLYQYYPNKQALVFALHQRTVEQAWVEVRRILDNPHATARHKVGQIAQWFFHAEAGEVEQLGHQLRDAEVFFQGQEPVPGLQRKVFDRLHSFVAAQVPPGTSAQEIRFRTQLLMTTLEAVGKSVAARPRPAAEVAKWATATATMLCDHLEFQ